MTVFALNSGHGINTKGKRSPFVPPGVLEYEFNIDIVKRIMAKTAMCKGISAVHIDPEAEAVGLGTIVRRVNDICEYRNDIVFMSIHANAMGVGKAWNVNAKGSAVFVAPKASAKSREFAQILAPKIAHAAFFDDRGVKNGGFYVLRKTVCPAVLTENGFMTHPSDATKIASDYWRDKIATAHVNAMMELHSRNV